MKPLAALEPREAARLEGLAFDLDDTVLDHGALRLEAFEALHRLRAAGLRLVACTGRPSGWGEVIARQWPVEAVVVENGVFAWLREVDARGAVRVTSTDPLDAATRFARRGVLLKLANELVAAHPDAALADDNKARESDVTIDIGEHRRVAPAAIRAMREVASKRGVRTHASSVHLHLTFEPDDKASGVVKLLVDRFAQDATRARLRWAFVGDSGNDAQAFACFSTTFGVANVARHAAAMSLPPRYVASAEMGKGFAEIAAAIVAARRT